jgi:Zn2+/Cd2+-exporting ATPase
MTQHTYKIGNMDCANCAREVETGVSKLDGVQRVSVDFASGKMTLAGDVPYITLKQRVEALGKTLEAVDGAVPMRKPERGGVVGFWDYLAARHETRVALVGGAGVLLTLLLSLVFQLDERVVGAAYTLFMLITVYPIARSGINTLRINREFNINLLMTIAAVGAVVIGEYLESATVIFLFAIGEALEGYTTERARRSLRSLLALAPPRAIRLHDGGEELVAVEALQIGDRMLVKPGERIPMDGEIISGTSSANQAPITGESIPVYKTVGDTVYAGSINGEGTLEVRVTQLAADNTLNRIIKLVEEAQSHRAPSQRFIDRFAHYYTPGVVVLALLVATVPPLLFGAPFFDTPDGHGWFYRALAMLVIACPCALVISTPVTVISAITAAARRGVLIKGGAHLEALGGIRAVAFDKTGTLTAGQPVVTQLRSVDCETGDNVCGLCTDVLALAAAVEKRSTHPLAQAVLQAAEAHEVLDQYAPATDVELLAGRGVQGRVGDRLVTVGSHTLFEADYPHPQKLCDLIDSAEAQGQTAMLLSDGDRVRGYIAVADQPRESSRTVIRDLNALDLQTVMLTGDNEQAARAIGRQVDVTDVRAQLMPEDKVNAVRSLIDEYDSVAMVGDGVNDTPALAAATVGIAMGGAGSAQVLETADIALMADDLTQLPFAIRLARLARTLIKQNVALSLGLKAVFLVLALVGGASLWAAVFADVGMSLLVTLNGMRPLRQRLV